MRQRVLPTVALVAVLAAGCGVFDAEGTYEPCASSSPIPDGGSTEVDVVVVTKPGLGENIIGTLDVSGGLYRAPVKGIGAVTNLDLGSYKGRVSRDGDELTLDVAGQSMPLSPEPCQ